MIDCIKKMWHIYTMEYYTVIKRNEILSFAGTWVELEPVIFSKLMQEQKTKHHMFSNFLHISSVIIYVFPEVTLLVAFKNFFFAFTTWLTGARGSVFDLSQLSMFFPH